MEVVRLCFAILFSVVLISISALPVVGQDKEQSSKLSFKAGVSYAIPFADIELNRESRKTVIHDLSSSIGFQSGIRYRIHSKKYFFLSVDYSSFNYQSTERFFDESTFSSSDRLVNVNINAGMGWRFPLKENNALFVQTAISYLIHNSMLENFFSERILPEDLSTINITTIDWDLFNRPGLNLGIGYSKKINQRLQLELESSALLSLIEGDIVDSPTSNDFDKKPNMSRAYWITNVGMGIVYNF